MFDAIDQKILQSLQEDGRLSHTAIAKEVGLSAPAIGERVRKLEQQGVIKGYQAVLDPEALGLHISAFVAIIPQARVPGTTLVSNLLAQAEIQELHAVAGEYSYIAKVRVTSTQALDEFLDRLFMLEGVERTQAMMILRTNVERTPFLPFGEGTR